MKSKYAVDITIASNLLTIYSIILTPPCCEIMHTHCMPIYANTKNHIALCLITEVIRSSISVFFPTSKSLPFAHCLEKKVLSLVIST